MKRLLRRFAYWILDITEHRDRILPDTDLADLISRVSPDDTPIYREIKKRDEWRTDGL